MRSMVVLPGPRASARRQRPPLGSEGGHGLRHSYAQERLSELQSCYHSYEDATLILSQELGHFRKDVVYNYLR